MSDESHNGKRRPNHPQPGDPYEIPPEGSLGLLAAGHRGLRAWRKVREKTLDAIEAAHGPEARHRHPAAPNIPDDEADDDTPSEDTSPSPDHE